MKIVSWNVNGLRAVYQKGFLNWFFQEKADIVCLQEIKAGISQIPPDLKQLPGYFSYFNPSQRPGYAGTAVFTKEKPLKVEQGIGLKRFDQEGRVLKLQFQNFTLFNLYMINGGGREQNMVDKLESYDFLLKLLEKRGQTSSKTVKVRPKQNSFRSDLNLLVGDFNVAHQEIDLAQPKENVKNTGFTPQERQKIDQLLKLGLIDTFRQFYPEKTGQYTWWTHWANARARNLGWRIDYCFASKGLAGRLKNAFILPEVMGSDHCPVGIKF